MSESVKTIFETIGGSDKEEQNHVDVNEEALKQILGNDEIKDLPLVVISINGRQRTGKSFMLTQFLKYLHNKNNPNWINCVTEDSFKWAGGLPRITPGIQVWSKPIIIEIDDNGRKKKVAVILLDCQGLFDQKTTGTQNTKLFAFSALLSSVFIFNDFAVFSDDVLNILHTYLEYAKFTEVTSSNSHRPIFQKLIMLHRDWVHDQEDAGYTSFKCGYYDDYKKPPGQKENLKKATFFISDQSEYSEAAVKTRSGILGSFKDTGLYAMASAGESKAIPKPTDSSTAKWNEEFKACIVDFVTYVLSDKELLRLGKLLNFNAFKTMNYEVNNFLHRNTKRIGEDVQVTGKILLNMALKWGKVLKSNDGPRMPSTIFETMVHAYYQDKISKAVKEYTAEMKAAIARVPEGMSTTDLLSVCNSAKKSSLYLFGTFNNNPIGNEEDFKSYKQNLEDTLGKEFQSFQIVNEKAAVINRINRIAEEQEVVSAAWDAADTAHSQLLYIRDGNVDAMAGKSLPLHPLGLWGMRRMSTQQARQNYEQKQWEFNIATREYLKKSKSS